MAVSSRDGLLRVYKFPPVYKSVEIEDENDNDGGDLNERDLKMLLLDEDYDPNDPQIIIKVTQMTDAMDALQLTWSHDTLYIGGRCALFTMKAGTHTQSEISPIQAHKGVIRQIRCAGSSLLV